MNIRKVVNFVAGEPHEFPIDTPTNFLIVVYDENLKIIYDLAMVYFPNKLSITTNSYTGKATVVITGG